MKRLFADDKRGDAPRRLRWSQSTRAHSSARRSLKEGIESNSVPEAKKVSLATIYNHGVGGNNDMWSQAVRYLQDSGVLNFPAVLQTFVPLEREQCLLTSSIVRPEGEGWGWTHSALLYMQELYDHECGITSCGE